MYVYCGNNPILREDDGGTLWNLIAGVIGAAVGAVIGAVAGGIIAYNAAKESGKEGDDLYAAMWGGVGKGAAVGAVGGALIAATGGAMAGACGAVTGAGSVSIATMSAGEIAVLTGAATVAAKTMEVVTLQERKSCADGDSGWQIVNDCLDSLFRNGGQIIDVLGSKALFAGGGYTVATIKNPSLRLTEYLNIRQKTPFSAVTTFFACLSAFEAWVHVADAAICSDPVAQANERGYVLQ